MKKCTIRDTIGCNMCPFKGHEVPNYLTTKDGSCAFAISTPPKEQQKCQDMWSLLYSYKVKRLEDCYNIASADKWRSWHYWQRVCEDITIISHNSFGYSIAGSLYYQGAWYMVCATPYSTRLYLYTGDGGTPWCKLHYEVANEIINNVYKLHA